MRYIINKLNLNNIYIFFILILLFYSFILIIQILQLTGRSYDIPRNNVFWGDYFLFIYASLALRDIYLKYSETKSEILNWLKIDGKSDEEITEADIQLTTIGKLAVNPVMLLVSGLLGGYIVYSIVSNLEVIEEYPYPIFHFFFGFNHSMALPIIIFGIYFIRKISKNYMKNIEILDIDYIGGFKKMSDLLFEMTILFLLIVVFDFIILYSTLSRYWEILICFMFVIALGPILLFSTFLILESTFSKLKRKKIECIKKKLYVAEKNFWKKLSNSTKEDISYDVTIILTLTKMLEEVRIINMWPTFLSVVGKYILLTVGAMTLFIIKAVVEINLDTYLTP